MPKLPKDPVDTLMKLNASAKFARNPSDRFSWGLIPSDSRCASSRAAMSWELSSSYHRAPRSASLTSGE
jgi:hypothetical protein